MNVLKFLTLVALALWIGGIVFFSAAVAPGAFAVLPSRHLAGNVVAHALTFLHLLGIVCGVVFLACSMAYSYYTRGSLRAFSASHLAVAAMLLLTLISQFGVSRRMHQIREQSGVVDDLPREDPRRIEFNRLHVWSTNLEGAVVILGFGVLWGTARRLS